MKQGFSSICLSLLFICSSIVYSSATCANQPVDDIATAYVKLVLAMGEHDTAYVDAYYGPPELRDTVRSSTPSVSNIATQAQELYTQLPIKENHKKSDDLKSLRIDYLRTQLTALAAYANSFNQSSSRNFDAEAKAFYDTKPPKRSLNDFDNTLEALEALLPGEAPLHERIEIFYKQYEIPKERLPAVFEAAINACRERTLKYITLPETESFRLEYVTDKPWSGYNWYQGGAHSLIQINTSLPVRIDRAIDLGCHEGYPGHHTYNVLLEANLVHGRGWVEFSVYPLFSPQSLIAEGSANYGIELAFPEKEKLEFEKKILYPLAGLDPNTAEHYQTLTSLTRELSYARNEIARQYINGDIKRQHAIELLQHYGPSNRAHAEQSLDFIDSYGTYLINYNWGKTLVKHYIERGSDKRNTRWQVFTELLSSPRLPSDLGADYDQ
ncbi:MAG: hypothetical protein ACK5ME_10770 [Parahaliea sp.]